MKNEDIENIFAYHGPFGDQAKRYEAIRDTGRAFAVAINNSCPESREKSVALSAAVQLVKWANSVIAINEKEG